MISNAFDWGKYGDSRESKKEPVKSATDKTDEKLVQMLDEGTWPHDSSTEYVSILAESWRAAERHRGAKPRAFTTPFRYSMAGECERRLGYEYLADLALADLETKAAQNEGNEAPPSMRAEMDLSGFWATGLGTVIHDLYQTAFLEQWPDAEFEVKTRVGPFSGSADVWLPKQRVMVELKIVNGLKYKRTLKDAEGPQWKAVRQAALNAKGLDADWAVIVYLPTEVNRQAPGYEIGAQWTMKKEQWFPIAEDEIERAERVLATIDRGELPVRTWPDLPEGAKVENPATGRWKVEGGVGKGNAWLCGYCPFQQQCINDHEQGK